MKDISKSIIILILSVIHVSTDNGNDIIYSEIFGGDHGKNLILLKNMEANIQ